MNLLDAAETAAIAGRCTTAGTDGTSQIERCLRDLDGCRAELERRRSVYAAAARDYDHAKSERDRAESAMLLYVDLVHGLASCICDSAES